MSKSKMKISVVIPCYNDYAYIEKAIDSVRVPDGEVEIIVVDDGSGQKTKKILNKLRPKFTKLIEQENRGVSYARNIGIENATHNVIVVLDSDDYFEEDFFSIAYQTITNDSEVKIVTCYSRRFNEVGTIDTIKPSAAELIDFLKYNAAMGSVMFLKSDWAKCGGYDESMVQGYEDWEFYIRLLQDGGKSYAIPKILFHYRIRKNSRTKSANKFKTELLHYIYKKHKQLYIKNFDEIIFHYMRRIEILEDSERKLRTKPEYKFGKIILRPLRKLKSYFNPHQPANNTYEKSNKTST